VVIVRRFIFTTFRTVDDANLALAALHNHPFDSKHTFKINKFTDFEKYDNMGETYTEPEEEEYVPRVCHPRNVISDCYEVFSTGTS
jgi:hypothetical protein